MCGRQSGNYYVNSRLSVCILIRKSDRQALSAVSPKLPGEASASSKCGTLLAHRKLTIAIRTLVSELPTTHPKSSKGIKWLLGMRGMGAIPQLVLSNRTRESVLINPAGELCGFFSGRHPSSPVSTTSSGECNAITNR